MRFNEKNRIAHDKTYGVTESVQWGTFYKTLCKKTSTPFPSQPPNKGFKSKSKTVNAPLFISLLLVLKVLKRISSRGHHSEWRSKECTDLNAEQWQTKL